MLQIGSVVDGKYKILNEVGHGGMSVVYLAINERANKTWAIKEIRKDGVVDFEAVKQGLVVETDMLKKLSHPHLPSIIDVIDTDDSFLIVMDYIEGKSLQSVLRNGGAQPQEQVVEWGKQLCDVLGYLHSRQPPIIYRDMKPANVMLKPDGNVTLIDFGTAREFKNRSMVEDTTCLGTRGYAAPEQFGGRGQTDARTDIYCLGATMYHLLTGHSPAEPPYEIKSLSYWDPSYAGSGMEKLIQKCCKQDPSARFQNCEELMYALEHLKDEDDQNIRLRKRKWRLFLISAILCLVGLVGMLGFSLAKGSAEQQTYDYYIAEASHSDDLKKIEENVKKAMKVDAADETAYNTLTDKLFQKDGDLSKEDMMVLDSCLNAGSPKNVDVLRSSNKPAYDELQYWTGIAYFFLTDHQEGFMIKSAGYFEVAKDSETLADEYKQSSEILYRIASSYSSLSLSGSKFTKSEYTYTDFWKDLNDICEMGINGGSLPANHRLAICEEVAYFTFKNCSSFRQAGITGEQINTLLGDVEKGVDRAASDLGAGSKDDVAAAREMLTTAQNAVKTEFEQIGG